MTIQELLGQYKASGVYDNIASHELGTEGGIVNLAIKRDHRRHRKLANSRNPKRKMGIPATGEPV